MLIYSEPFFTFKGGEPNEIHTEDWSNKYTAVAFDIIGNCLAIACMSGDVRVVSITTHEVLKNLNTPLYFASTSLSSLPYLIVPCCDPYAYQLLSYMNSLVFFLCKVIRSVHVHDGPVYAVIYYNDGQRLLTCSKDGLIILWNALNFRRETPLFALLMCFRKHSYFLALCSLLCRRQCTTKNIAVRRMRAHV
jgi:WD40 repeat protein